MEISQGETVRKTETERERERPAAEGEKSEKKYQKKPFDLISRVKVVRFGDLILGKMEIVRIGDSRSSVSLMGVVLGVKGEI